MSAASTSPLRDTLQELGISEADIRRELPPTYSAIAREIGLPATMDLIESLSGRQVYVPARALKGNRLAQAVGMPLAQKVADLLGGDRHIVFPLAFGDRTMKRLKGVALMKGGASNNDVVSKLRVSRRTVIEWRSKYRDETWGVQA